MDIETPDAKAIFTGIVDSGKDTARPMIGPFVRLIGYAIDDLPVRVTTDVDELVYEIERADVVQGHNLAGFDLLAVAWHCTPDPIAFWTMASAKMIDTDPLSRQHTPPRSRTHGSEDQYDLDHVALRLGVTGKITGEGGLAALKRKYGGYDRIPVGDPQYRAYLVADVEASRAVARILAPGGRMNAYARREHRLATLAGHMTLNGQPVDVPLLHRRIKEGEERKQAALKELHEVHGVPTSKEVTRGRAPNKVTTLVPMKAPLATRAGKDGLIAALRALGVRHYPFTEKTKRINPETGREERDIATGREPMDKIARHYDSLPGVARLCELVTIVTTTRTVYQTALNYLAPDGRVHPKVSMRQASGRWSVTEPGMTVYGKRDGKWVEREIFCADDPTPKVAEWCVITCDLSQVDMRGIAGHCQDKGYMAMFEPGQDAHQILADKFGIARQDAKPLGHGYNYGLGAKRMIKEGHKADVVWAFVNGMQNNFPTLMEWREEVREIGGSGEILDNGFGRKMRCDPRSAYTVAPALMGQGAARDITCESLLTLMDRHPEYLPYLRGHAHDEFVFIVPKIEVDVIGKEIKAAFEWTWRGVPILADLSPVGSSWGACSAK
jgi:DNA polymerase-1